MEKLINSIKLISFNYMYSSNKTLDRFGIEYSYIASAMGNMLKSTNNEIRNVNIDETVSILIDWTWSCILHLIWYIGAIIAVTSFIIGYGLATGPVGVIAGIGMILAAIGVIISLAGTTMGVIHYCFGGF